MAPRRRGAATGQSTLSFRGQSRVTKPSTTPTTLHKAKIDEPTATLRSDKSATDTPEPPSVETSEPSAPVVSEVVVRQQKKPSHKATQTAEEKQALGLNVKDLKKYWSQKGGAQGNFRVHDKDVALEEKILRQFDLTGQYGPCIGLSRLQRWRRAQRIGLNPPIEVLSVLLKGEDIAERSHMEELAS